MPTMTASPQLPSVHTLTETLTAATWKKVNQRLLSKMLAEFMYEEIIQPVQEDETQYRLALHDNLAYTFTARQRLFDRYQVDAASIYRHTGETKQPAHDVSQFLLDLQPSLNLPADTLAHLLHEYNQTLLADAHIYHKPDRNLTRCSHAELEGHMTGHPWITYNKGRIGFSYSDYLAYAPEQQQTVQLLWLAVHKELATFHAVDKVTYEQLLQQELGPQQANFFQQLQAAGLDPAHYWLMPVHPWQWEHYLVSFFTGQIANQQIVPLGLGTDHYLPQQSVRTFSNLSQPSKHHVKLPISILNTLVYRGLPGERTVLAPLITQYIHNIWKNDPFLRDECQLILPGEIASLNVDHPAYQQLPGTPYHYQELLGCIWRESITNFIAPDEQAFTLAALLHVDNSGTPLLAQLVTKSGLTLDAWLDQLMASILPPLLHYLYHYGLVFSPHGQNAVLVLRDSKPSRLAIKDFVDDVNVSQHPLPELANLPAELRTVLRAEPPEGLCQFIFSGLFIGHFRYLADLLETHFQYDEVHFWKKVRQTILDYQSRFPEREERFQLFDLLQPSFTKLCLNRNRLLDYGYSSGADRPHAAEFGQVRNGLYEVGNM